ncbi:STAS domain-containing protein [Pyxidicoccus fallax]|uniref:STAS domain-containing protein n=1 Tax=Pyxidicoccus fallax TaxID=394095 RepID=A0A848L931_9BACT|nr:STAS domain-containing protein [Pyxidicoccus fallax]NMO15510.1 STAS domain-containing protein [Pyxidicoccus fallax]NPC81582.1 STAS domain-containing protein [Pyxidicoccus fallax]
MNQVLEVRRRAVGAAVGTERVETLMLEGELSEQDLLQLCEELTLKMQRGLRQVVLDFADVGHLNYRGVKPLMARAEAFRRTGGDLKLSGLSPYLAAIFRAAGAHDAFEIYPHMNDARAAFALSRAPFV